MNIIINYDLIDEIKNATEPLSPLKLIRCKRKKFCFYYVPALTILNSLFVEGNLALSLAFSLGMVSIYETLPELMARSDFYAIKAKAHLQNLTCHLGDNNVETSYDLLLDASVEAKEYHLYWNEHKLPALLEQKYILLPTYGFDGEIRDLSLVQEHTVGTNRYVLSIGRYNKGKRLSFVHSNA